MVNDVYLDSSFVVKLNRQEQDSLKARAVLSMLRGEAIVSELTDLEVLTVLNRNLLPSQFVVAATKYRQQRTDGLYGFVSLDSLVFIRAMQIAEQHAKPSSLRSLDILHLASTLRHGIPTIVTFDKRLGAAAVALGLAMLPA